MEQHLVDIIRKPWVVLVKLVDEKGCNALAKHWLNRRGATWKDFKQITGITLPSYFNHYIEAGGDDAPTSPFVPGKISPVLVIRRGRGSYVPSVLEITGFLHNSTSIGWVKTSTWETILGDEDYLEKNFPKVEKQSDKGRQQVIAYAADLLAKREGGKP